MEPSHSYASNHNLLFQQEISAYPASGLYHFKGVPNLLFAQRRRATDGSLLMCNDIELFDLKKVSIPDFPIWLAKSFAGHFLSVGFLKFSILNEVLHF